MVRQIANGQTIAASGTVQTSADGSPNIASLGSPALGFPRRLSIGAIAGAATTITINVSYDGVTWLGASILGTNTRATMSLDGTHGIVLDITPAPYVQLVSSASATLKAWAYTS